MILEPLLCLALAMSAEARLIRRKDHQRSLSLIPLDDVSVQNDDIPRARHSLLLDEDFLSRLLQDTSFVTPSPTMPTTDAPVAESTPTPVAVTVTPTFSPTVSPTFSPTEFPVRTAPPTNVVVPTIMPMATPTGVPTDAPVVETDAPVVSTASPVAPTDAPVVATDAPVAQTDAPVVATDAPVVSTDAPVVTTDAPTDAPVAEPTQAPVMATDAPVMPTEAPVAATAAPVTPAPVAATAAPVDVAPPVETPIVAPVEAPVEAPVASPTDTVCQTFEQIATSFADPADVATNGTAANAALTWLSSTDLDPCDATNVQQAFALVVLYESMGGEFWAQNTDWLETEDYCLWARVVCDNETVVSLSLCKFILNCKLFRYSLLLPS